jgi:hypothetical protein
VVKAGVLKDPVVPVLPPPAEEQEVLLVDDQVITEVVPIAIEEGDAETVMVGATAVGAATVIVVLWFAVPPAPVQVTE